MHVNSFQIMAGFRLRYLNGKPLDVLDVGAKNVNGTYRPIFKGMNYVGVDCEQGNNVDFVTEPYKLPFPDTSFDVVISGQTLEHCEYPWLLVNEMARVLRPNGKMCLVAPSVWEEHRYPYDCFRFMPDGMKALCRQAGLEPIKSERVRADKNRIDCYVIAEKR